MKQPFKHKECPEGGQGVHAWLYHMACAAVDAGIPDEEAAPYIAGLMTRPPAPPQEVEHALAAARGGPRKPSTKWPVRNFKLIQTIFRDPLPTWKPTGIGAEQAVDVLFPGNPLLCVGLDSARFTTKPREAHRGFLMRASLIVPSPMSARQGRTLAGKLSEHSLDNTGPRRFLITEFDWGTQENQMRLIAHLGKKAPLTAVVSSGGKSLHAWWYCAGKDEAKLLNWMQYAVSLGADFRTWLKSQFVRLPGGRRENGNLQHILFLDPKRVKG